MVPPGEADGLALASEPGAAVSFLAMVENLQGDSGRGYYLEMLIGTPPQKVRLPRRARAGLPGASDLPPNRAGAPPATPAPAGCPPSVRGAAPHGRVEEERFLGGGGGRSGGVRRLSLFFPCRPATPGEEFS